MKIITRRQALFTGLAGSGLLLTGCSKIFQGDALTDSPSFQRVLAAAQSWTRATQRLLLSGGQMAQEYKPSDISRNFRANGTYNPGGADYSRHVAEGFVNWRLQIDGLVAHPLSLSVADLRRLPSRSQITRHDCVEGWSAIGGWTGVPLALLLRAARLRAGAKYVVFYCADSLGGDPDKGGDQSPGRYYESIGLADATHPQTLIAYDMNGKPLDVAHGAPLRLRVERQLGYKMAKYVRHIQVVSDFRHIAGGQGGYWEDRGYDWYAGI
ncbi:MAG TPA: molybdopterin-dependent oxidoreductase [Steroidobacteraceae bacterium]|nr:molybdopterin-dependent oxidoreductase [Steroidobacteraceae bacterium]